MRIQLICSSTTRLAYWGFALPSWPRPPLLVIPVVNNGSLCSHRAFPSDDGLTGRCSLTHRRVMNFLDYEHGDQNAP